MPVADHGQANAEVLVIDANILIRADWPVLATALALGSPIWTEDNVFFGAGVATWTTDRVELFLSAAGQSE